MGRVRGKGKKQQQQPVIAHEDPGSGGEEKNPAFRRRGRPQKPLKDDVQIGEELEKIEEDIEESKSLNYQDTSENGRKRKRSLQTKEETDSVKEENNGIETKSNPDGSTKFVSFRHVGSRRKNKPHRAAEVGVECN